MRVDPEEGKFKPTSRQGGAPGHGKDKPLRLLKSIFDPRPCPCPWVRAWARMGNCKCEERGKDEPLDALKPLEPSDLPRGSWTREGHGRDTHLPPLLSTLSSFLPLLLLLLFLPLSAHFAWGHEEPLPQPASGDGHGTERHHDVIKEAAGTGKPAVGLVSRSLQVSDDTPSLRLAWFQNQMQRVIGGGSTISNATGGVETWGLDTGAREEDVPMPHATQQTILAERKHMMHSLALYPRFNLSDPYTISFANLADYYLAPWRPIEGLESGPVGAGRGIISLKMLNWMSHLSLVMSCAAPVKIVHGKIYFRWGGFLQFWYRTRRFVLTLKTIAIAIKRYNLQSLNAEFMLNACDHPMSFDNSIGGLRAGYPFFSAQWRHGSLDVHYPDPMDFVGKYIEKSENPLPWSKRKNQVVFRGATSNYDLDGTHNWRVSPRFRLHLMTKARPDLLDAQISKWAFVSEKHIPYIEADGYKKGKMLNRSAIDEFKYELNVDGGLGTSRTCGTFISGRVMFKQDTEYTEFFWPLLKPYVHYIPTKHYFQDLYKQVEWAQAHEDAVLAIRDRAHKISKQVCSWEGRYLYWAILLVKYSHESMEDASAVTAPDPENLCSHDFPLWMISDKASDGKGKRRLPPGWPSTCSKEALGSVEQPPCAFFCTSGSMQGLPEPWVTMDSIANIPLHG